MTGLRKARGSAEVMTDASPDRPEREAVGTDAGRHGRSPDCRSHHDEERTKNGILDRRIISLAPREQVPSSMAWPLLGPSWFRLQADD